MPNLSRCERWTFLACNMWGPASLYHRHPLMKMENICTSEQRVNAWSLASSIALQRGLPVDDIQTLSKWATSTTFQSHHCREHLSIVDFTNSVLSWAASDFPLVLEQESGTSPDDKVFFQRWRHNSKWLIWSSTLSFLFYFSCLKRFFSVKICSTDSSLQSFQPRMRLMML